MVADCTAALADFATSHDQARHQDATVRALVDTVGVSIPGQGTEVVEALLRWASASPVTGPAVIWGRPEGTSAARAALINGTAAHALDFDDAAPSMPMHPSAVLWPALLARSDARDTGAPALMHAFEVGQAAFRALGEALPMGDHYPRGWHSTATIGRLAAVAALASLSGLDTERTRHAIGIAASMSAGSIANFGTMTKPLHAGFAAHDAVIAVELVEAGVTANPSQLDDPKGFFALFGDAAHERDGFAERLTFWLDAWVHDLSVKQYPSCYGTHRAIDAILDARADLPEPIGDFVEIEVVVHQGGLDPLITRLPVSGLEGKFSLPYTTVRALTDGYVGLDSFSDEAVVEPTMADRMDRVSVRTADQPIDRPDLAGEPFAQVSVVTRSGQAISRLVTVTRGDARNPLSDDEVDAKFRACTRAAGWQMDESDTLLAALRALPWAPDLTDIRQSLRRA